MKELVKLVVFVPEKNADEVRAVIVAAGAAGSYGYIKSQKD